MKSEWTVRSLGELVQFISGGTPNKKRSDYWRGKIPWISAKTLKNEQITTSDLFISEDGLNAGSKMAPCGSILLLTRGSGLFNDIPIGLVGQEVAFNQDIKCLNSCSEVENKFIFYWLISQKKYLMAKVGITGIGAGKFDLDFLQKLEVTIPSKQERDQIVAVADVLSDKIKLNQKINDNLQQQAQALYQQMFIDCPNPDWTDGSLSDIAEITMGQSPSGSSYNEEGRGTTFFQGRAEFGFRFPTVRLYTTEPKRMARKNDILMSVRAPVGDINVAHTDCCIGRGLATIHSKNNHQSFVLYTMFSLKKRLDVFNSEGTVFGSINRNSLNDMPILIPSDDTIEEFERIVAPMDAIIRNNYDEICRLQKIRDYLLPRLMSGELDVSTLDI